jgi:hypothetical protein
VNFTETHPLQLLRHGKLNGCVLAVGVEMKMELGWVVYEREVTPAATGGIG